MASYNIIGFSKGRPVEFRVDAPTAAKAVLQSRQMAREQGMGRITISAVQLDAKGVVDEEAQTRPESSHGRAMNVAEINAEIARVLGDVPLHAFEQGGHIYLSDGINSAADGDDASLIDVMELLYDWAVFVGYTNEEFEDFLAMSE
ncbi:MAG: hypothetical protein Q7K03_06965 [Dehalococcoidia bacterium]|nr:hypothetical protein [Dehalococcoidia bacterium]